MGFADGNEDRFLVGRFNLRRFSAGINLPGPDQGQANHPADQMFSLGFFVPAGHSSRRRERGDSFLLLVLGFQAFTDLLHLQILD